MSFSGFMWFAAIFAALYGNQPPSIATAVNSTCPELHALVLNMTKAPHMFTDKFDNCHFYQHMYGPLFRCSARKPLQFFEIGIGCYAGFMAMEPRFWSQALPAATQHYMDYDATCPVRMPYLKNDINGKFFIGDQGDPTTLSKIIATLPEGMDVIMDDGSHQPRHQVFSLNYLFPRFLRPGGYYVIEDMFFNFVDYYNGFSRSVSVVAYIGDVLEALATNTSRLPAPLRDCTEVVCQLAICWFKKSKDQNRSRGLHSYNLSRAWCDPEGKTLMERQLACEDLRGRVVLYVKPCEDSQQSDRRWDVEPLFSKSHIVSYGVGDSDQQQQQRHHCLSPSSTPHSFVVIDDAITLSPHRRLQTLSLLFPTLQPGGYYFWKNDPQNSTLADAVRFSLYSLYCDLDLGMSPEFYSDLRKLFSSRQLRRNPRKLQKHEKPLIKPYVRTIDSELCNYFSNKFTEVRHVGCDHEQWCFLQKRFSGEPRITKSFQRLAYVAKWGLLVKEPDQANINALKQKARGVLLP